MPQRLQGSRVCAPLLLQAITRLRPLPRQHSPELNLSNGTATKRNSNHSQQSLQETVLEQEAGTFLCIAKYDLFHSHQALQKAVLEQQPRGGPLGVWPQLRGQRIDEVYSGGRWVNGAAGATGWEAWLVICKHTAAATALVCMHAYRPASM